MESRLITSTGSFPSTDNRYVVTVTIENHIVFYEIRGADAAVPLAKGRVGSAFHKFFLIWDEKNNLWIDGEDTNRVIFFEKGRFREHDKTVADYKDPNFPKPPAEWHGPNHR